jgi:hypothetical protein
MISRPSVPVLEAILEDHTVKLGAISKVQHEPEFEVGRTEIAEQLPRRIGVQPRRRFDLYYKPIINDHVHGLPRERLATIIHHYGHLSIDPMAVGSEVLFEGEAVNVLSVAKAKSPVHVEEGTDDRLRQPAFEQSGISLLGHPLQSVQSVQSVSSIRSNCSRRIAGRYALTSLLERIERMQRIATEKPGRQCFKRLLSVRTAELLLFLAACVPTSGVAQLRVNPDVVNVSTQDATTVFLSYGGLRADQRLADALWCGSIVPATPDRGFKCDPASRWGQLPLRYDRATTSGIGGFTDIMSIPVSIARRAYQSAARGSESSFFYVRRVVSTTGGPDAYVVVVCRLAGGGAAVPLSLTDVRLTFAGDAPLVFVSPRAVPNAFGAEISYTGSGRLAGRWEVVRPGEELPSEDDLVTEATLPLELRARQRRYTEIERFNVFLPPSGRVTLAGPDPSRLPTDVDGTYLVLLRIEASDDPAGNSSLDAVGSGSGIVRSGAVAGFPLPALRYVVGASERDIGELNAAANRRDAVRLLLPSADATLPANTSTTFGWLESPGASFYRIEIQRADGETIHSAIVARGFGSYRAPPWLAERAGGQAIKWRVLAVDGGGRARQASPWRRLKP